MATVVERSRTSSRPPGSCTERVIRRPSADAADRHTKPDGLVLRPAARPGDAGDAHPDVRVEPAQGPEGQRLCDLERHRPVAGDELRIDARDVDLRRVRVRDDAAEHVARRARALREARREEPAGAGLRGRDRRALVEQRARHEVVDGAPVVGEQHPRVTLAHEVLERRVRRPAIGPVARDDLDLPTPQARRDLQRREVDAGRLRDPQRLGDLGLRHAVHAQRAHREGPGAHHARRAAPAPPPPAPTSPAAPTAARAGRRWSGPSPDAGADTRPGAVPTGSRTVAPTGTRACLRVPSRQASLSRSGSAAAAARASPRCAPAAARRAPGRAPGTPRRPRSSGRRRSGRGRRS